MSRTLRVAAAFLAGALLASCATTSIRCSANPIGKLAVLEIQVSESREAAKRMRTDQYAGRFLEDITWPLVIDPPWRQLREAKAEGRREGDHARGEDHPQNKGMTLQTARAVYDNFALGEAGPGPLTVPIARPDKDQGQAEAQLPIIIFPRKRSRARGDFLAGAGQTGSRQGRRPRNTTAWYGPRSTNPLSSDASRSG